MRGVIRKQVWKGSFSDIFLCIYEQYDDSIVATVDGGSSVYNTINKRNLRSIKLFESNINRVF